MQIKNLLKRNKHMSQKPFLFGIFAIPIVLLVIVLFQLLGVAPQPPQIFYKIEIMKDGEEAIVIEATDISVISSDSIMFYYLNSKDNNREILILRKIESNETFRVEKHYKKV